MNFVDITPNLNDLGIEILGKYLKLFNGKLTTNLLKADNIISEITENPKHNDPEFIRVLKLCEESIFPNGKPSDSQYNIDLSDCKDWCALIENAINELNFLKWSTI